MAERVHYFNMGPWPVYVGFTTSEGAYAREMKRLKVKEPTPFIKNSHSCATTHFFTSGPTSTIIICAQSAGRGRSKEQYAALMAHEAVHVIQEMRDWLGDLGVEAEAYIVQQIVQEALQIAWKTGRSCKRKP